jgi:phosphoadenosine phosphosulfate reductase
MTQTASFMSGAALASSAPLVARAAQLDARLEHAAPAEIIEAALNEVGRDKLALVSSFGTESAALLKFAADVDPAIPVIFLDTGWLFEETLGYRDTLTRLFGLKDVRTIHPLEDDLVREDKERDLWFSNPDRCCFIRKVAPLARALGPFEAWLNGRKRFQGGDRAAMAVVEADNERLKFNPLANVTLEELKALYATMKIPPHPLLASGFTSIGCMPCTSRTAPGEDPRAGRWRGKDKTECGIHVAKAL